MKTNKNRHKLKHAYFWAKYNFANYDFHIIKKNIFLLIETDLIKAFFSYEMKINNFEWHNNLPSSFMTTKTIVCKLKFTPLSDFNKIQADKRDQILATEG